MTFSDNQEETGSPKAFQVKGFSEINGLPVSSESISWKQGVTANLNRNANMTSSLSHAFGTNLLVSKGFFEVCDSIVRGSIESQTKVDVRDENGNSKQYFWCSIPSLNIIDADSEKSLMGYFRSNLPAYPNINYPHIPNGSIEILPLKLRDIDKPIPEGGWFGRLVWLALELKPEIETPPIFRMRGTMLCSDNFRSEYEKNRFTGLQFRKLDPTVSQLNGEKTLSWIPQTFL